MSDAPDGPISATQHQSACAAEELRYKLAHIIDVELASEARQDADGKSDDEAELIYAVTDCQSTVARQNLSLMEEDALEAIYAATVHPEYSVSGVVIGALGEVFDPKSVTYLRDFSLFYTLFRDAGIAEGEFHHYLYRLGQVTGNWSMVSLRRESEDFLRMIVRVLARTRSGGDLDDRFSDGLLDMVRDDPSMGEHVIKLTTERSMKFHSLSPALLIEIDSHPVPALRDGIL